MNTKAQALPEPDGYFYEVDGYFGIHRQFDTAPYNGMRPHRTVGYFAIRRLTLGHYDRTETMEQATASVRAALSGEQP